MGLRAGWLALFLFVWIIGAFLGSTYEYQSTEGDAGVAYSTGTATFTTGSNWVTSGGGVQQYGLRLATVNKNNIITDSDSGASNLDVGWSYSEN